MTVVVPALEKSAVTGNGCFQKEEKTGAVEYCSCQSKDETKPVKLFNMPLLKLASVF